MGFDFWSQLRLWCIIPNQRKHVKQSFTYMAVFGRRIPGKQGRDAPKTRPIHRVDRNESTSITVVSWQTGLESRYFRCRPRIARVRVQKKSIEKEEELEILIIQVYHFNLGTSLVESMATFKNSIKWVFNLVWWNTKLCTNISEK